MKALQLLQASSNPAAIAPRIVEQARPACGPTEALVRVHLAAINPSDVKASLGHMPQAVWPRTPGRDYVGTVEAGPAEWIGKTVFGSGGDVGITRDGSHATWLVLPRRALLEKPAALSDGQAACFGVPYVTALDGFLKAGWPQPGEAVLVAGAMGKVGLAAAAIARLHGAQVIGIKRAGSAVVPGHAFDQLFDQDDPELTPKLLTLTGQKGFPLVFNTVGSPYLALSLDVLAQRGRQVLISTLERDCPFDIFKFFRKELSFHGVDTLKKDTVASNELLARLVPHIASGRLLLPQEGLPRIYPLEAAGEGFRQTFLHGGIGLLQPQAA
jgi:NADPH:quinone reductase